MREFGISVEDPRTGRSVTVFFIPMTYIDWLTHSDEESMLEPANVRYLLAKYITRCFHDEDTEENAMEPLELMDIDPQPLSTIIHLMIKKSGFSDTSEFEQTMKQLEYLSRTLMGAYDTFIMLNAGMDTYLNLLEQEASVRASFIVQLEHLTGIDVSKRFEECLADQSPLDVVNPPDVYERNRMQQRKGRPINSTRTGINRVPGVTRPTGTPPGDFNDLTAASRAALDQSLAMSKANKDAKERRAYNWQQDNADIMREMAQQDRDMMNVDRKQGR